MNEYLISIQKLELKKEDLIIITVSSTTPKEEAFSIFKNIENLKLKNNVVITTPNIRLSTLSEEDLKKIGLQKIK